MQYLSNGIPVVTSVDMFTYSSVGPVLVCVTGINFDNSGGRATDNSLTGATSMLSAPDISENPLEWLLGRNASFEIFRKHIFHQFHP